jgi:glucosamine--fructose-6-phosphate aminotransferase (isomerizing)
MSSILHQEICQQPEVIKQLLLSEEANVESIAKAVNGGFNYILIAARGTSDNAARYAQYLFGSQGRIPVALATPSLYTLYNTPPQMDSALVIGISQSGQSPDIVSVIAEGRRQNRPTIAITNDPQSPLAKAAEFVIELHTGPEKAVAATKTYTSSLAAMALLNAKLFNQTQVMEGLRSLPQLMQATIEATQERINSVERYRYMDRCAVLSRGFNYATAFEISLKITELTRVIAEPYSSADFRHGPIAMARDGFPVILVAPTGQVTQDLSNLIDELNAIHAEVILISDQAALAKKVNRYFPLPTGIPEWLSPMVAVLPGQLFAMTVATLKGMNPDQPEGLHKVTETM